MWLGLAVLVLCACGGAKPVAVENRGGTASTSCDVPPRLDFEARRYGNLDGDQPDYQTWSPWRVGILFADREHVRGTISMQGDELVWNFDLTGKLDRERCTLELWADTHLPIRANLDLRARTGTIRSIDDVWQLGPPFPENRP
jgi:hypothetical protein